jgi:hypothetical protein
LTFALGGGKNDYSSTQYRFVYAQKATVGRIVACIDHEYKSLGTKTGKEPEKPKSPIIIETVEVVGPRQTQQNSEGSGSSYYDPSGSGTYDERRPKQDEPFFGLCVQKGQTCDDYAINVLQACFGFFGPFAGFCKENAAMALIACNGGTAPKCS